MKKVIVILFITMVSLVTINEKENILIPDNAIRKKHKVYFNLK